MKRIFLAAAFLVAGFAGANAQSTTFGAGVNANLPIGDFSDLSSFGVGLELQAEHKFNDNVAGIATTGFSHFIGKDLGGGLKFNVGVIPILVGGRYFADPKFYFGAQIGYSFFVEDASEGGFSYKPQVGYDAGSFQLGLSYNGVSNNGTLSWLGLSGIFKFGGK